MACLDSAKMTGDLHNNNSRKRMSSEISSSDSISIDKSRNPSQVHCIYCKKEFDIKLCACKCRIECVHCKNWWIRPYQTSSDLPPAKKMCFSDSILKPNSENSGGDPFEGMHDDILSYLLSRVGVIATSPLDLLNLRLICKRFKKCMDPWGMSNISGEIIHWIRARWSEEAKDFLTCAADVGSPEACYFLGMICYYCMEDQTLGITLLERAAKAGHAAAFYSLAVIHFRHDKSGNMPNCKGSPNCTHFVCAKWAQLGRLDVLCEMGFNLESDPHFSSPNNLYALKESALELMAKFEDKKHVHNCQYHRAGSVLKKIGFEWGMGKEVLEARKFIDEFLNSDSEDRWHKKLEMCSNLLCGRKEKKGLGSFEKCNSCKADSYCSLVCQEMHKKMNHY